MTEPKDYDKYVAVCSGCYKEWYSKTDKPVFSTERYGNAAVGKPLQPKGFKYVYCKKCAKHLKK